MDSEKYGNYYDEYEEEDDSSDEDYTGEKKNKKKGKKSVKRVRKKAIKPKKIVEPPIILIPGDDTTEEFPTPIQTPEIVEYYEEDDKSIPIEKVVDVERDLPQLLINKEEKEEGEITSNKSIEIVVESERDLHQLITKEKELPIIGISNDQLYIIQSFLLTYLKNASNPINRSINVHRQIDMFIDFLIHGSPISSIAKSIALPTKFVFSMLWNFIETTSEALFKNSFTITGGEVVQVVHQIYLTDCRDVHFVSFLVHSETRMIVKLQTLKSLKNVIWSKSNFTLVDNIITECTISKEMKNMFRFIDYGSFRDLKQVFHIYQFIFSLWNRLNSSS